MTARSGKSPDLFKEITLYIKYLLKGYDLVQVKNFTSTLDHGNGIVENTDIELVISQGTFVAEENSGNYLWQIVGQVGKYGMLTGIIFGKDYDVSLGTVTLIPTSTGYEGHSGTLMDDGKLETIPCKWVEK